MTPEPGEALTAISDPQMEELIQRDSRVRRLPKWARELMVDLIDEREEACYEAQGDQASRTARADLRGIWMDVAARRARRGDTDGWLTAMRAVQILGTWPRS